MALQVNNQPNAQQIQQIPVNHIVPTPFRSHVNAAQNGSSYLQDGFGSYQLPIYVKPNNTSHTPYGSPLPNNSPPINVQQTSFQPRQYEDSPNYVPGPRYYPPQGPQHLIDMFQNQLQPQSNAGNLPWELNYRPLLRPLRIYQI